jgi:hypothetical protein
MFVYARIRNEGAKLVCSRPSNCLARGILLDWFQLRGLGQGSRNDIDDFESQGFIKQVEGERVKFYYRGIPRYGVARRCRVDIPPARAAVGRAVARRLSRRRIFSGSPPSLRRENQGQGRTGLKLDEA